MLVEAIDEWVEVEAETSTINGYLYPFYYPLRLISPKQNIEIHFDVMNDMKFN